MIPEATAARPPSVSGTAHAPHLRRELGLSDLVFTQILFIIGLPWVGVAAKLGPAHVVFWLIAIALFYIPSAIVVIYLNRLMPLEGGLYQWAKLGFNDFAGFMVAWNLWLFAILNTSETGIQVTQYLGYVLGPARRTIGRERPLHRRGQRDHLCRALGAGDSRPEPGQVGAQGGRRADGRDLRHAAAVAVAESRHGNAHRVPSARDRRAGHLGDEPQPSGQDGIRRARRLRVRGHSRRRVPRSGADDRAIGRDRRADHRGDVHPRHELGAGVGSDRSDRPHRADSAGAEHRVQPLGWAAWVAPVTIVVLLVVRVAQASVLFTGNTRLPMVAGWDGLLPAWFTRLHERYRTPVNSVVFVAVDHLLLQPGRRRRRRQAGRVSAAVERVGDLLRADLSGDVRDSDRRPEGASGAPAALDQSGRGVRVPDDRAVRDCSRSFPSSTSQAARSSR